MDKRFCKLYGFRSTNLTEANFTCRFDAGVGSSSKLINPSPIRDQISLAITMILLIILCREKNSALQNTFLYLYYEFLLCIYCCTYHFQIRLWKSDLFVKIFCC